MPSHSKTAGRRILGRNPSQNLSALRRVVARRRHTATTRDTELIGVGKTYEDVGVALQAASEVLTRLQEQAVHVLQIGSDVAASVVRAGEKTKSQKKRDKVTRALAQLKAADALRETQLREHRTVVRKLIAILQREGSASRRATVDIAAQRQMTRAVTDESIREINFIANEVAIVVRSGGVTSVPVADHPRDDDDLRICSALMQLDGNRRNARPATLFPTATRRS